METYWTEITIGGAMPLDAMAAFEQAFEDEMDDQTILGEHDTLQEAVAAGATFGIAGQCAYGNPEAVRDLCLVHGLHWHCQAESDGCTEIEIWHPGMLEIARCLADGDGNPVFSLPALLACHERNLALADVVADLQRFEPSMVPPLTLLTDAPAAAPA